MRYYLQISAFAPITEIEAHIVPPVREQGKRSPQGFQQQESKHDNYYR